MIPKEVFSGLDKAILSLNSPFVVGAIVFVTIAISAVVVMVLLRQWSTYRPSAVVHLNEKEEIIKIFRKHPFIFWVEVIPLVIALLLPFIVFFLLPNGLAEWLFQIRAFLWAIAFTWVVLVTLSIFIVGANYFLDTWILTNERLIDVEQKGLFHHDLVELALENIQDIRVEIQGIIKSLLHIGDVHIQSAGSAREFVIFNAISPREIKSIISEISRRKIEGAGEAKIVSGVL